MRADLLLSRPLPPALLLLVASLVSHPSPALALAAQASPRPPAATTTLAHHALKVVAWPLPTSPPVYPFDDLRRRQDTNTVCGYIGGNPNLAATCSAGSHCVLDSNHGVIGCCPNGPGTCTAGVFTGCVDRNSEAQTEVNPYVFTCTGSNVCFKNVYDGGFSQFGCGTASDLGTSVFASASGIPGFVSRPTVSVPFTAAPSSSSVPTTPATTSSSSTSSSSSSSSRSTSSSSLTTITDVPPTSSTASTAATSSATSSAAAAPPASPSGTTNRTGAVVGGIIGGIAVAAVIVGAGIYFVRRRGGNSWTGPERKGGPGGPTKYISPRSGSDPVFSPVHQTNEAFERGLPPGADYSAYGPYEPYGNGNIDPRLPYIAPYSNVVGNHDSYPPPAGFHYPSIYAGGTPPRRPPRMEGDEIPLTQDTREIDDFSQGFHNALGRIGEEEEEISGRSSNDLPVNGGNGVNGGGGQGGGRYKGGMRPLWQQNRRQSRSLMWV